MTWRIATLNKIHPSGLARFGEGFEVGEGLSPCDGLLVRSAQVDTDNYPGLLAVGRAGAGVNNISVSKATASGICVFNTPGANANAVAELVFFSLGLAARNLLEGVAMARSLASVATSDEELDHAVEKAKGKFAGFELAGRTLGVVGLGKIGMLVANLGRQYRMNVLAFDPNPAIDNIHRLDPEVQLARSMSEVVRTSDVLTVHVPLVEKTRGMIDSDWLSQMRTGSLLVNFSRGPIIVEDAVIASLDRGTLGAYLCDFPTRALAAHPRAICTPHLGASTEESEENCAVMAADELRSYIELGNVTNSVNFPNVESIPHERTRCRLVVINRDIPNMIAGISGILGEAGVNIVSLINKSNGTVGYNIVDLEVPLSPDLEKAVARSPDVIRARVIPFEH